MAFIPATNTVRTAVQGSYENQQIIQTLWFLFNTTVTDAMMDALNTALETWYKTYVLTQLASTYTLESITSTDQTASNGSSRQRLITSANTGGITTGTDYPGNVALATTLLTGKRGRSYRGRVYWGGFKSGSIGSTGQQILASAASALAAAIVPNLINSITGVTGSPVPVVASHYANKQPRIAAVTSPITAATTNTYWDSQRRRLFGRGK